jgi:hypothetical protein
MRVPLLQTLSPTTAPSRQRYKKLQTNNSPCCEKTSATLPYRAKKYDERLDEWQARVSRGYRFYFQIEGDTYVIVGITKHPK